MMRAPPLILLIAIEFGRLARQMQSGQSERVAPLLEKSGDAGVVTFGVALEDFRRGDRHGRIEEHLHRGTHPIPLNALAKKEQNFLGAFERECRDDDIAAAGKRGADGVIQLLDGGLRRSVQSIAIGGFHHHDVCGRRGDGRAQQWSSGVANVSGIKDAAGPPTFLRLDENAGRAEDMTGIEKGGAKAGPQLQGLAVGRRAGEAIEAVERVEHRIERHRLAFVMTMS